MTEERNRRNSLRLSDIERITLAEVERTHLCHGCLEPLPQARLDALPGVTLCVRCAQRPYVRPVTPEFPPGNWKLLEDATEAPVLHLAEPERRAEERAANLAYRQIETLDENEDLTSGHDSGTL